MKKITSLLMIIALVLSLAACGTNSADSGVSTSVESQVSDAAVSSAISESSSDSTEEESQSKEQSSSTAESSAVSESSSDSTEEESQSKEQSDSTAESSAVSEAETDTLTDTAEKNTLVVYYSASGNTRRAAEEIAAAAGADLFEIVPEQPYTDEDLNWTNSDSRVCLEHDDESLRDVPLTTIEVPEWESYDTVLIGYPIWWGIAAWPVDNFVKGNDFSDKTVIPFATSASSDMGESGALLAEMAGTGDWQEGQRFSSGESEQTVRDWVDAMNLNQ